MVIELRSCAFQNANKFFSLTVIKFTTSGTDLGQLDYYPVNRPWVRGKRRERGGPVCIRQTLFSAAFFSKNQEDRRLPFLNISSSSRVITV